jgi:5,10-methylenetetrahydromethanopterin reductase
MKLPVGVAFDGFLSIREAMQLAREAVSAGATSLWAAEHLGYREATLLCMAFATSIEGAVLVPTAVSPYLWHPTTTAMAMTTLAEAAPGRAALAVGIGNPLFLQESGKEPIKPVRAVEEFVQCLRALWSGEAVHYSGETIRLAGARMGFQPPAPIPIYIAAMGPDMLRLTGRLADGVVLTAGLSPEFIIRSLSFVDEGARRAGRDAKFLRKAAHLFLGVARDGRRARELVRGQLAFVFRNKFFAENIAAAKIPIDQEAIIAAVSRRDLSGAARLVPDEAVETFAVSGTPTHCLDRLKSFIDAGVEEPVVSIVGDAPERELALQLVRELTGSL